MESQWEAEKKDRPDRVGWRIKHYLTKLGRGLNLIHTPKLQMATLEVRCVENQRKQVLVYKTDPILGVGPGWKGIEDFHDVSVSGLNRI